MYHNGEAVPKDDVRALEWFQKAAGQGLAEAEYTLGMMYYEAQGAARDYVQAAQWLHKAAEQGLAESQFNMGMMYCYGRGVERWPLKIGQSVKVGCTSQIRSDTHEYHTTQTLFSRVQG